MKYHINGFIIKIWFEDKVKPIEDFIIKDPTKAILDDNEFYTKEEIHNIYKDLLNYIKIFGIPEQGTVFTLDAKDEASDLKFISVHLADKEIIFWF